MRERRIMKRKALYSVLTAMMLVCLIILASCRIGGDTDPDGNGQQGAGSDNGAAVPENTVYSPGTDVQIVYDEELPTAIINMIPQIYSALDRHMDGGEIVMNGDGAEKAAHEIVIGECDREISAKAYKALARRLPDDGELVGFLIYSDGSSLAVAYGEDRLNTNAAITLAINKLIDDYVRPNESLKLRAGVVAYETVDPIEFQRRLDDITRENALAHIQISIGGELGERIVAAIREYYSLFSPDVVTWLANLYDPVSGGFYYSNSGRDTLGYGADLETTGQALGFIETSGMISGGSWSSVVSDEMKAKLVRFTKSLQDPNGYFYHPQWPKDLADSKPHRLGRDLSHAVQILRACGSAPTYTTPSGVPGDGILADGTPVGRISPTNALTPRLGASVCTAVSLVIGAADNGYVAPHLVSDVTFKAYLDSLDIRGNSYSVGNTLTAQSEQFVHRDRQLKEQGKRYSLVKILEQWLLANQNPENGMWYWLKPGDEGYHLFDGVNGLLKLVDLYNRCGLAFPNALAACESAIESITCDETAVHVCYPYNAWFAVDLLFDNLTDNSKNAYETQRMISEIRARLLENAPTSIKRTMEQVALFRKDDGSFSFTAAASSSTSQGMQVAVPNTNEGDVNATVICVNGVANHMFSVLGIDRPPLFGKAELYIFLSVIEALGPIVKDEEPEAEVLDIEEEDLGGEPTNPSLPFVIRSSGSLNVVPDPEDPNNKVLRLSSVKGGGDQVNANCPSMNLTSSCYTFRSDILIDPSTDKATFAQILLHRAYMLVLTVDGDRVWFSDSSSQNYRNSKGQDLLFSAPLGEWFNLTIEYYPGDHDTVRIMIYLDGELMAVSDNYYDGEGKKLNGSGIPSAIFTYSQFLVMSDFNATVYLDDLVSHKSGKQYVPVSELEDQPPFNVDEPDRPEIVYGFDETGGEDYPDGFTVVENGDSVGITDAEAVLGTGNALCLDGGVGNGYVIGIPVNKLTANANATVVSADIFVDDSTEAGTVMELILRGKSRKEPSVLRMHFKVVYDGEGKYLTLVEAPDGAAGRTVDGIKLPLGVKAQLEVIYFKDAMAALVSVDGILLGMNTSVCSGVTSALSVGKLELVNPASVSSLIYIDNLKVEGALLSFAESSKPDKEQTVYDFNTNDHKDAVLEGGAAVEGKKLLLKDALASITLPLNKRSPVLSATVFYADVRVPATVSNGTSYRIAFLDSEGNLVLAYDLIVSEDKVGIHEVTSGMIYGEPIASFARNTEITLSIEYYAEKDEAQIYLDGKCVAVTSILYNGENAGGAVEQARISASGASEASFDNLIIEGYNKFHEAKTLDNTNREDGAEKITFEYSSTGNLPSGITSNLKSVGAKLKVVEMLNKLHTKVLSFTTLQGGNDAVYFDMANKEAKGNAAVFDADLYIDYNTYKDTTFEIYLTTESNSHAYLLTVGFKDGTLSLCDISGASSAVVPGRIWGIGVDTGIAEAAWFNIRIEYYFGNEDAFRAKTYVNGELILVSNNFYGKTAPDNAAVPKSEITAARISSYNATDGVIMLDNVALYRAAITLEEDELTESKPIEPDTPSILDKPVVDPSLAAPGMYYESLGGLGFTGSSGYVAGGSGYQILDGLVYYNTSKGYTWRNTGKNYSILSQDGTNKILTMTKNVSWSDMYFKLQSDQAGNCFVFEADIKLDAVICSEERNGPVLFFAENYNASTTSPTRNAARAFVARVTDGAFSHYTFLGQTVEAEKWYTVTVEYYADDNTVKYYIDGVCYDTAVLDNEADLPYFGIYMETNSIAPTVSFDNAVYTAITVEAEEKEPEPEEPTNYYEALGGLDFTNSSGYVAGGSGYQTLDGLVYYNTSKGYTWNNAGKNFSLLTADGDNKYLTVTRNVSWSDVYFKKQSSAEGNCLVFEADIKLSAVICSEERNGPVLFFAENYNASTTSPARNAARAFVAKVTDGAFSHYTFLGQTVEAEKWYTVTVEYYADAKLIRYYLDGVCYDTATLESEAEMPYFGIFMDNNSITPTLSLDNVVYKCISREYAEEPETEE